MHKTSGNCIYSGTPCKISAVPIPEYVRRTQMVGDAMQSKLVLIHYGQTFSELCNQCIAQRKDTQNRQAQ